MKNLIIAFKIYILLTIITGLLYPLAITGFAQTFFSNKANGSLIIRDKKILGSELIGQQFNMPEFFWGRPSAIENNPMPSGGSNLNPVGLTLKDKIQTRVDTIRKYHGNISIGKIPKELLFASASGVDPHISPETAYFQLERIAKYRHLSSEQKNKLNKLIQTSIEAPDLNVFGEFRINVLKLNMQLDGI
jgi:K+-transporting ATPase ATPase C chain